MTLIVQATKRGRYETVDTESEKWKEKSGKSSHCPLIITILPKRVIITKVQEQDHDPLSH